MPTTIWATCFKNWRLDEAEASYRQVIALTPDHAEAYYNLGNTLKGLGKLDEAEASYRKAIALKPIMHRPSSTWVTRSNSWRDQTRSKPLQRSDSAKG